MRRVNLDTLEIEEVDPTSRKNYVYVLLEESNYDYEHTCQISVFKDFDIAFDEYKAKVKKAKEDIRKWVNADNIVEDETIEPENKYASFDTYDQDDYDAASSAISVQKKEVI